MAFSYPHFSLTQKKERNFKLGFTFRIEPSLNLNMTRLRLWELASGDNKNGERNFV